MPLSQTLANNENEIRKLITQRQESLDQTIDNLIAADTFTYQSYLNRRNKYDASLPPVLQPYSPTYNSQLTQFVNQLPPHLQTLAVNRLSQ